MTEHPLETYREAEARRLKRPVPRYEIAEKIGCSKSRYTQIVKDRRPPSAALLSRIKKVTKISADTLLEASR